MKLSFDDYISSFIAECDCKNLSDQTTDWYQKKLVFFKGWAAEKHGIDCPSKVAKPHLKMFIQYLMKEHERKLSIEYVRGFGRTLTVFYNYLEKEYNFPNPAVGLTMPKLQNKHFPTLTESHIQKLLNAPEKRGLAGLAHFVMMYTLLDTGVRVGELVSFKICDVNFEEGWIRVLGKGSKERLVPMGRELRKLLLKYKSHRPEGHSTDPFFINSYGVPFTRKSVGQFVRRYGRQAGITGVRVSPHTFRHTFATMYILNGGDSFSLQKILGHSSPAIVQVYVNMTGKNIIEQHRKFSPGDSLRFGS